MSENQESKNGKLDPYMFAFKDNPYIMEHLEQECSVVPPELLADYMSIEQQVGAYFISLYGRFLSDEQKSYLLGHSALFTTSSIIDALDTFWNDGIRGAYNANIGKHIYIGYQNADDDSEDPDDTKEIISSDESVASPTLYDAGALVAIPIEWLMPPSISITEIEESYGHIESQLYICKEHSYDQFPKVNLSLLQDKRLLHEILKMKTFTSEVEKDLFVSAYNTNFLAAAIIHEKLHNILIYDFPLPVLETMARFYEEEVVENYLCPTDGIYRLLYFVAEYRGYVEKRGDIVHKFAFESLRNESKKVQISNELKDLFSNKKIRKLSRGKIGIFRKRQAALEWIKEE